MAIESSVLTIFFIYVRRYIKVFDCRLSGVDSLAICKHENRWHMF